MTDCEKLIEQHQLKNWCCFMCHENKELELLKINNKEYWVCCSILASVNNKIKKERGKYIDHE